MEVRDVPAHRPWSAVPAVDVVVAAALLVLMLWDVATATAGPGQRPTEPWTFVLTVAICVPYVVHRRFPLVAVGVTAAAVVLYAAAQYGPYPLISTFVLLWGVARHAGRRQSMVALVAGLVAASAALALQPSGVVDLASWVSTLLGAAVAWLVGENMRHRRARWHALEERAALLEERTRMLDREREERTRQALVGERLRIARELHDVVAHSMSVVAVQSGMAQLVLDTRPEDARSALAAIESTSRSALTEMRRLLEVLRQDDEPHAALAPAPGLADVPALVEHVRGTGRLVDLTVDGDVARVPQALDLTGYRIVQEALTNVVKHGGGRAAVRVAVDDDLRIEVTDTGRTEITEPAASTTAGGHGLVGMRERVAVFAGCLDAEQLPDGGFRVVARLPLAGVAP